MQGPAFHLKHTCALAALLLASIAQAADPAASSARPPIPQDGPPAEELVKNIYENRKFPVMLDKLTRADSVQGKGDTLTYNFTVVNAPKDAAERKRASEQQAAAVEEMACGKPGTRRLIEAGYTLWFNYDFGSADANLHIRLLPRRCPD